MKVCASEPRAPRTLTAKVRSRSRSEARRGPVGRDGILARREGPLDLEGWRCAARREVSVCWRLNLDRCNESL